MTVIEKIINALIYSTYGKVTLLIKINTKKYFNNQKSIYA